MGGGDDEVVAVQAAAHLHDHLSDGRDTSLDAVREQSAMAEVFPVKKRRRLNARGADGEYLTH